MKNLLRACLVVVALLVLSDAAFAQATGGGTATAQPVKYTGIGAGIGMGLAIVGAGLGIGLVGFAALSGIARQPEQSGTIRGAMILLAALVEGAALIAVVFCLVLALIAS
ncbi:MAG: ATP synthase F0 subunit C [Gemmataceae bacterium]|jgi:ATP synthase F0 subunit c|nr:ATP synthase F0 subunit C [Gemmataceae bacterium]